MILPRTYPSDFRTSRPMPSCGMCFDRGYVYFGDWRVENRVGCPLRCPARTRWLTEEG